MLSEKVKYYFYANLMAFCLAVNLYPNLAESQSDSNTESFRLDEPEDTQKDDLKQIRVKLSPVPGNSAMRRLQLRAISIPRCVLGDFEAMLFDMMHSPGSLIAISIEPILPRDDSFLGSSAIIADPKEIIGGTFVAKLEIPYASSPTLYGLYVCKKSSVTEVCRTKKFDPINDVLEQYTDDPKKRIKSAPPERNYFFTFLLADKEEVIVSKAELGESMRNPLYDFLRGSVLSQPNFEDVFQTIWRRIKTLGPYPLGATSTSVVVNLPRYDKLKCTGQAPSFDLIPDPESKK